MWKKVSLGVLLVLLTGLPGPARAGSNEMWLDAALFGRGSEYSFFGATIADLETFQQQYDYYLAELANALAERRPVRPAGYEDGYEASYAEQASLPAARAAALYRGAAAAAPGLAYSQPFYPKPYANVNDYAGVLSSSDTARLNGVADVLLRRTGVSVAVAVLEDTHDVCGAMYSARLYEKWGIGRKGEDRGLLVVVSLREGRVRMEVGYGLESVITDTRAGQCLEGMLPYFARGEYGEGLYRGLLHAASLIADDAGIRLDPSPVSQRRGPQGFGGGRSGGGGATRVWRPVVEATATASAVPANRGDGYPSEGGQGLPSEGRRRVRLIR
ncbi:MAG: TPM domain-containing protein [Bacillota bacterium]